MNDHAHFKRVLQSLKHFECLPEITCRAIATSAMYRRFDAGQVIYVEGEPAASVYILEQGWVKDTRMNREGREQAMMFLRPVDLFGDIGVFTDATYPGTTTALEVVEVWAIPAGTLIEQINQFPDLAVAIIHNLGKRVLHYINLVEDLSLRNVEARLANTLLRNAENLDGYLVVPRQTWTTFDEMAVRLGTVRDVLGRALKTLEAEALLKVEKNRIILCNPARLAERGNS
jgi:CRP/FNR family cyclic AMP-dependent transcriptional regulator